MSEAEEKNDSSKRQNENIAIRRALSDAYAFVEGQKLVQSFSSLTFEELLDQQIERIEGVSTVTRPNEIERISRIEVDVVAAVQKIKQLPDDAFRKTENTNNVNTKP